MECKARVVDDLLKRKMEESRSLKEEASLDEAKRRSHQKRMGVHFSRKPPRPVEYIGHGYEYPHKASVANFRADICYYAGLTADHKAREVGPVTCSRRLIDRAGPAFLPPYALNEPERKWF